MYRHQRIPRPSRSSTALTIALALAAQVAIAEPDPTTAFKRAASTEGSSTAQLPQSLRSKLGALAHRAIAGASAHAGQPAPAPSLGLLTSRISTFIRFDDPARDAALARAAAKHESEASSPGPSGAPAGTGLPRPAWSALKAADVETVYPIPHSNLSPEQRAKLERGITEAARRRLSLPPSDATIHVLPKDIRRADGAMDREANTP